MLGGLHEPQGPALNRALSSPSALEDLMEHGGDDLFSELVATLLPALLNSTMDPGTDGDPLLEDPLLPRGNS